MADELVELHNPKRGTVRVPEKRASVLEQRGFTRVTVDEAPAEQPKPKRTRKPAPDNES